MEESKLQDLLNEMTLEEKVGQLTQVFGQPYLDDNYEVTGPMSFLAVPSELVPVAGSILGASGAESTRKIQDVYLEKSRLKIPLLFMADVIHGYKTIFPIPLGIGASWNPDTAVKTAKISAVETAVSGIHVTFSPMVDLVRDPRWGRVMESTGEDKFLNEQFAEAFVRGYQGDSYSDPYAIASCVKHFAAYGAPEGGRDYNTVNMSERQLREDYLSAYQAAIDAGTELVMTSFNVVDGIPSTGNRWLLKDLLRDEMGFEGVVISDWGAVKEMIPHGVAADEKEAALKALNATNDIEMMTFTYHRYAKDHIDAGHVDEKLIDESVMRILKLKNKLGLFENPYRAASQDDEKDLIFSDAHRQTALEVAEESMVLLKNDSVLPLEDNGQTVALIGPFAEGEDMLGAWSWKGEAETASSLHASLKSALTSGNVLYAKGSAITETTEEWMEEAVKAASEADVVIMALGESAEMSGEAASRSDITLPQSQADLLKKIAELGKPIATVLFNGRPLDLNTVEPYSDAILEAWFPGTEGGEAVANLLTGKTNPSGKLPMSFPESVGQIPVYYNHYNTGRPAEEREEGRYASRYLDVSNYPKYAFGYGLSYTSFDYSKVTLSSDIMTADEPIEVNVTLTNTGKRAGQEAVQLYIRDLVGEVVRPKKELKGFRKVQLNPGESKKVSFTLSEDMLTYVHQDLTKQADAGEFDVFVGASSLAEHSGRFSLKI
ncbi:MAG: beta-glucosidase BglX [Alkalibacterium sp.]|nr:beta-glucosidase BglX [Alkalibacterium sp.]